MRNSGVGRGFCPAAGLLAGVSMRQKLSGDMPIAERKRGGTLEKYPDWSDTAHAERKLGGRAEALPHKDQ
jgi:hypothetical protein